MNESKNGTNNKSHRKPDPAKIMQMANAFHESCVLFAALDLDIFSLLEEFGQADAGQIADASHASPRGIRLLLDGCAAIGLVKKDARDFYSNTEESQTFLVRSRSGYLGSAIKYNRDVYAAWGRLREMVETGKPVEEPELHLGSDPERTRTFVTAMHGRAMAIGRAVIPHLDLSDCSKLLDIGGGSGAYSILLARRWPHLQSVVFDLPAVAGIAGEFIEAERLSERIRCVEGNYNTDLLPDENFDTAILFGILHQESPGNIQKLLQRVCNVLKPGGSMYVLDMMTDSTRYRPRFSALFAINMALTARDGWVFSDSELCRWACEAGFSDFDCRPLPPPMPHWLAKAKKPL